MRKLDAYTAYMVIGFAGGLFLGMTYTVLSVYYVTTVGMNPLQLVLVGTVLEATVFVFEVPTGVVADTYSRRLSVIAGYFLIGVCYVITGLVSVFAVILLAEFIRGIGETFISGATSAWITDELGEDRVGRAFARYQQFHLAGSFLGIVAGAGIGALQLNAAIFLGGAGVVGMALFLGATMPERGFTRTPDTERATWRGMWQTTRDGLQVVRAQPVVLMFALVAVAFGAFSEGFDRLWEAHFLANIGFPDAADLPPVVWIAAIRAGSMLVGILVSQVLIRRLDFGSARALSRMLFATTALLMVCVVAFGLARGFVAATVVFWAAGGLRGIQYPVSETWLNRNIPSRVRATVLSMVAQADALGQVGGGPVLGAVGVRSLRAAMVMSGLLLGPAVLLYAKGVRMTDGGSPDDG